MSTAQPSMHGALVMIAQQLVEHADRIAQRLAGLRGQVGLFFQKALQGLAVLPGFGGVFSYAFQFHGGSVRQSDRDVLGNLNG